ncbi:MAG: hypothetical protein OEY14_11650, partial [Myxococcales bacterium]|nr:hypothetical protein [Myxococcales bacterium]
MTINVKRMSLASLVAVLALASFGCGGDDNGTPDGSVADAEMDAAPEAAMDAPMDAVADAVADAVVDAPVDAPAPTKAAVRLAYLVHNTTTSDPATNVLNVCIYSYFAGTPAGDPLGPVPIPFRGVSPYYPLFDVVAGLESTVRLIDDVDLVASLCPAEADSAAVAKYEYTVDHATLTPGSFYTAALMGLYDDGTGAAGGIPDICT